MSAERPHHLRRWLAGTLIVLVLLLGVAFAALQFGLARVPEYQAQLQQLVRERTGLAIDFRRVDTSLHWYGPEVVFWGAVVRTPDDQVLASARRGAISLALGRSLLERRLVFGRISLDGPELGVVRTEAGKFRVVGFQPPDADQPADLSRLPEGRYRVRDARIRFVDEQHGRAPWVLSQVALDLQRTADGLRLEGSSDLPPALGRELSFRLRLSGDLARAQTWQTEAELDAQDLQLARWRESAAPDLLPLLEGVASVQLRTRWQGSRLHDLTARLDARDLVASVPQWTLPIPAAAPLLIKKPDTDEATATVPDPPAVPASKPLATRIAYDRVSADVELRRIRNEWRLQVERLNFAQAERARPPAHIEATWRPADGKLESLALQADHLAVGALWPLLGWLPERESLARLRALEVEGDLSAVTISYARADGVPNYRVQARLHEVGFAPVGRVPGLAGLSATLSANEGEGSLALERGPLRLSWPSTFRDELALDRLEGALRWSRGDAGWQIRSEGLSFANHDGRVEAQLQLTLPDDASSPQVELTAEAYDLDARATSRYLPANRLTARTLDWLDRAFVTGHVPHATVKLAGALRQFPFRQGGGELVVRAEVENLTLDYQHEWVPATEVRASVEFRNAGMQAQVHSARLGGIAVERAQVRFQDFKQSVLTLDGSARSDVSEALGYLQSSPLGPAMGPMFMGLTGRGGGAYAVALTLPLKNLAARHVDVTAKVANAWVDHEAIEKPVARLHGSLRVVNRQVHSGALRGQWLGGPLVVDIEPQGSRSLLAARGTLSASELGSLLHLPAGVHLHGESAWSGYAQLGPRASISGIAAHVDLEMDGTTVALPAPLGKEAHERRPLSADLELQASAALVRATFGHVRAVGRIVEGADRWRFDRAGVRADGAAPSVPAHEGVRLEGRVDTFVLDEWLALQSAASGSHTKRGLKLADVLRAANLEVGEFGLFGYRWRDVRGLLRAEEDSWRVDVAAAQAEGHLQIPYDFSSGAVLTANMERLVLPRREGSGTENAGDTTDPRRLPALQAQVREFAVEDHGLGELTLQLSRVARGVQIDKAQVRGASFEGEATGSWLVTPAGQLTSLDVLIASSDVRDTLSVFNYSPFMQAKHAEVKGRISWPGGLSARWLAQANGRITVHADQGQLLKLEPGAGRVLGLFSFSALPRRLSLDFTDLTGEGLSFDTIHGDFDLYDGNAYTSNLLVSGPATEIGLAGRTGLATHDYDQTVVVTGKLGASLPVAGALAGGPAVAAAVLLFSQLFKEPLKGVTRGYYRITGTWEEPVVERIHGTQAREATETSRAPSSVGSRAGAQLPKPAARCTIQPVLPCGASMPKAAVIQMTSASEVQANLDTARRLLEQARERGAVLAALPENFPIMGRREPDKLAVSEPLGDGPIQSFLSATARELGLWIVAGTIPIRSERMPEKVAAAELVFDAQGQRVARYDKIHLFDVDVPGRGESYRESKTIAPGDQAVVVDTPIGRLGLAVCYDVRFPELFRSLLAQSAQVFCVPAAFTAPTGLVHWEVLLRARAIENLCYVLAPAQWGRHANGRDTYGDSMIVHPWGQVLDRKREGEGLAIADIDLSVQAELRSSFPCVSHRRLPL